MPLKFLRNSYYFDANGYMLADEATPDSYYVDANGAWVKQKEKKISIKESILYAYFFTTKFFMNNLQKINLMDNIKKINIIISKIFT